MEKSLVKWVPVLKIGVLKNCGPSSKIKKCITMAGLWVVIQVYSNPICMVQCTHLITTGGTPHLYNRGSIACRWTLCILEKICNFTNGVQISFIQTLKLIAFPWTIWWCKCELVEWPLIFSDLYQHKWMGGPDATTENTHFLRSGSQEAAMVMGYPGIQ